MSGPRDRDDDRDDRERPRRSWREIDRMRDGTGGAPERVPRGTAARARADAASREYRRQLDRQFARGKGGAEGERLARAMRDAHGTSGLAEACRAYREAVGPPEDVTLVSLFLDSGDRELTRVGLESLRASCDAGSLQPTAGLRSQLRLLAQDRDDDIAEAAESLLESI
jgi:hypothetical protein